MKKIITALLLCFIVIAVCFLSPQMRVKLFVAAYGDRIERSIAEGDTVAPVCGVEPFISEKDGCKMYEFILFSYGSSYYGCYYSACNEPLPFQNSGTELYQSGGNLWEWTAEGDNHGMTKRIKRNWFYFKASF